MSKGKKPMSRKQRYAFRYWRRGLRAVGIHLDRHAMPNGIMYSLSGRVQHKTFHPGKFLPGGTPATLARWATS